MGLDYYLIASKKISFRREHETYILSRYSAPADAMLSYFSDKLPLHLPESDGVEFCLTLESWDRLMEEIGSRREEILYLYGFVESAFEDLGAVDECRDLSALHWPTAASFDRWFAGTFNTERVLEEKEGVISLTEENARRIISNALTCVLIYDYDELVRPRLEDPYWTVTLGRV